MTDPRHVGNCTPSARTTPLAPRHQLKTECMSPARPWRRGRRVAAVVAAAVQAAAKVWRFSGSSRLKKAGILPDDATAAQGLPAQPLLNGDRGRVR